MNFDAAIGALMGAGIATVFLTFVASNTVGGEGEGSIHNKARFDAVCDYLAGETNGDLCIKDNTVILRKGDVK